MSTRGFYTGIIFSCSFRWPRLESSLIFKNKQQYSAVLRERSYLELYLPSFIFVMDVTFTLNMKSSRSFKSSKHLQIQKLTSFSGASISSYSLVPNFFTFSLQFLQFQVNCWTPLYCLSPRIFQFMCGYFSVSFLVIYWYSKI